MYFPLMAAMFNLLVTPKTESIHTSPTMLLDPENVGVAIGIQLPTTIQDLKSELQVFPVTRSPFWFPVENGWILVWFDIINRFSFLKN